MSGISLAATL